MKASHVSNRIAKRGTVRCQSTCLGWVVQTTSGNARLVACQACNSMHPSRLQVTDAQVRLLPLASQALDAARRDLLRAKRERATTRHVLVAGIGALCGHRIGHTEKGRRAHVLVPYASTANCAECIRLAAMTPAERETERRAKSAALAEKFKAKRSDAETARLKQKADTEKLIASAREDALVALDILETVDFDHEKLAQLALNDEAARTRLELVLTTLATAVTAHRHANPKSRGERRWVFRSSERSTRGSVPVRCRFCDVLLVENGAIGTDYTTTTDDHTVRCALEYLTGKIPVTNAEPTP